jgi:hypothetical protein
MARQFVTWHTAQTPHGLCSWAVVDGLLQVRSALGTKFADIGGPDHKADVAKRRSEVRFRRQTGHIVLIPSFSAFDPNQDMRRRSE